MHPTELRALTAHLKEENKEEVLHWCDGSGFIALQLTQWHLDNQPIHGDCESSVKEALDYEPDGVDTLRHQFICANLTAVQLIQLACEHGCNDYGRAGLPLIEDACIFLVWIAIGDLQEQQIQEG